MVGTMLDSDFTTMTLHSHNRVLSFHVATCFMPLGPCQFTCRPKTSLGTRTVSDSLRLQVTGEQPAADQQGSMATTAEDDFEGNGASGGTLPQPGAKPEELGNSRGKRMAMKFVNKIASKEKYTQVRMPACQDRLPSLSKLVSLRQGNEICLPDNLICCLHSSRAITFQNRQFA